MHSSEQSGSKQLARGFALCAATTVALFACAHSRVGVDVSELERVRSYGIAEIYVRPDVESNQYTQIWIEPVRVAMDRDPRIPRIAERERQRMADYFETQIRRALEDGYPLVDGPAPDTLLIRATITGLAYNRPPLDYDRPGGLEPGPRSRTSQEPKVRFSRVVGVGEAWIEVEFFDSETGELLAVVADRQRGVRLQDNANRSSTWGDAKQAFRRWARQLRYRLDELQGEAAG
jgi:hypothetical protein